MVYTDKNAKLTIKKAVIVKLLLVYLKTTPRWRGHHARAISNKTNNSLFTNVLRLLLQNTYFSCTIKNLDNLKGAVT